MAAWELLLAKAWQRADRAGESRDARARRSAWRPDIWHRLERDEKGTTRAPLSVCSSHRISMRQPC